MQELHGDRAGCCDQSRLARDKGVCQQAAKYVAAAELAEATLAGGNEPVRSLLWRRFMDGRGDASRNAQLALATMQQDADLLQFGLGSYKEDRAIVLAALREDNREIVLAALKQNGMPLQLAGPYRDDREIVLEAVWPNGGSLDYASAVYHIDEQMLTEKKRSVQGPHASVSVHSTDGSHSDRLWPCQEGS